MIKQGDKVKYIGAALPQYTGEILEVKAINDRGVVILLTPERDRGFLEIEGMGVWRKESLICDISEVEEVRCGL